MAESDVKAELLFREVKNFFMVQTQDMLTGTNTTTTGSGNSSFLWTSQGLIPRVNDCDEVYRNIYIGNGRVARDLATLKSMNVSLVVNAAHGQHFSQIPTNAHQYQELGISFIGIPAYDNPSFKMAPYFKYVNEAMERCIGNSGIVYVHCHQGLSRSATLVLAYLMIHRHLGLLDALKQVRQRRMVVPNDGFLMELCRLEMSLRP